MTRLLVYKSAAVQAKPSTQFIGMKTHVLTKELKSWSHQLDPSTARRFLDAILSRGGSRDALEAFVEFRGRRPEVGPLLKQHGIAAASRGHVSGAREAT